MSVLKFPKRFMARRIMLRRGIVIGFFLGVVFFATSCLPGVVASPTSGLTFGKGPLDAIRDAASRTTTSGPSSQCGLSSIELAVMMMTPTYFEAGGPVPSPMALSRWDNVNAWSLNANLFAFGQTTGPYVNAFFSPGIGLWQFDSAGRWDLTAADAIDVVTASNTAAAHIASKWCDASRDPYWNANPQRRRPMPGARGSGVDHQSIRRHAKTATSNLFLKVQSIRLRIWASTRAAGCPPEPAMSPVWVQTFRVGMSTLPTRKVQKAGLL